MADVTDLVNTANLDSVSQGILDDGSKSVVFQNTNRSTLIADAVVAHALNSTFSDTEAEAALNALGVKINAIIDVLIERGIMKAS